MECAHAHRAQNVCAQAVIQFYNCMHISSLQQKRKPCKAKQYEIKGLGLAYGDGKTAASSSKNIYNKTMAIRGQIK